MDAFARRGALGERRRPFQSRIVERGLVRAVRGVGRTAALDGNPDCVPAFAGEDSGT